MLDEHADIYQQIEQLLDQSKTDKPVVVVWGLMNAGKSFLLNMLTGHTDTDFFKTNDIRETADLKRYEADRFIFIDTPGLDAKTKDDELADQGIKEADVVLFVHQPQGSFESVEIDFLQKLKKSFGEYANSNIVLVLSKIDKEPSDKIDEIHQNMIDQCEEIIGFSPRCFQISSTRYQQGVQKNKKGLVYKSGLDSLNEYLNKMNLQVKRVRKQRQQAAIDSLEDQLNQIHEDTLLQIKDLKSQQEEQFSKFNDAMSDFSTWLQEQQHKYDQI